MAKHKNPEHFKVKGDKKVRVIVEFDAGSGIGDKSAMQIAADYLNYTATSGIHKSWGREIEVQYDKA